jgi:hypothetical protein
MTAVNGPLIFNSSTGSDTAASGSGPATAVTGTGASLNATTTVDLSADTPDLSTVSAGDILWVQTTSGQQFAVIASVDDTADTVTVDDAYSVTESSRTWAIGGKRATIDNADSRKVFDDWRLIGVMDIELETDQTITGSAIPFRPPIIGAGQPWNSRFYGTAGSIKTITQSANDYHFDVNNNGILRWSNLKFANSNATKNTSNRVLECVLAGPNFSFQDCVFGDSTNSIDGVLFDNSSTIYLNFSRCLFQHTDGPACSQSGPQICSFIDCFFDSCESGAEQTSSGAGYEGGVFVRCIFKDITNEAIRNNSVYNQIKFTNIEDCIFDNCGKGVTGVGSPRNISINNCIFMDCTTAIDLSFNELLGHVWRGNAFYNNTTDYNLDVDILYYDTDEITLTGDPFTDSANNDYTLNSTAGAGQTLRETSITDLVTGNVRYPFGWMVDPSGGGGGFRRISLNGGFNG